MIYNYENERFENVSIEIVKLKETSSTICADYIIKSNGQIVSQMRAFCDNDNATDATDLAMSYIQSLDVFE